MTRPRLDATKASNVLIGFFRRVEGFLNGFSDACQAFFEGLHFFRFYSSLFKQLFVFPQTLSEAVYLLLNFAFFGHAMNLPSHYILHNLNLNRSFAPTVFQLPVFKGGLVDRHKFRDRCFAFVKNGRICFRLLQFKARVTVYMLSTNELVQVAASKRP